MVVTSGQMNTLLQQWQQSLKKGFRVYISLQQPDLTSTALMADVETMFMKKSDQ